MMVNTATARLIERDVRRRRILEQAAKVRRLSKR